MRKFLVLTAIAVFIVVGVASFASAAPNVTQATKRGSLLVFPKIDARGNFDSANGADLFYNRDAIVVLANDGPTNVTIECIWSYPNLALESTKDPDTGVATRVWGQTCCNSEDFTVELTPQEVFYFSAASGLADLLGKDLITSVNKMPADSRGIASLYCFAVDNGINKQPISYNYLHGEVTNFRFEVVTESGGLAPWNLSSWGYQGYAFAANGVGRGKPMAVLDAASGSYTLPLNGANGGYDACPDVLVFNFQSKKPFSLDSQEDAVLGTDLTLVPCTQDLRYVGTDADPLKPTRTLARFDIFAQNEREFSGTRACIKCFFEAILGNTYKHQQVWVPNDMGGGSWVNNPTQVAAGYFDYSDDINAYFLDAFQFVKGDNFNWNPLHGGIGTMFGHCRVQSMNSACAVGKTDVGPSVFTGLLGVKYDFLDILQGDSENVGFLADSIPEAADGKNITGVGKEKATIRYLK